MISPRNGTDVHLKWHQSLFTFRLTCLHMCSTLHDVSSWSLSSASYPTTNMSSAILNRLSNSSNISSIFLWNMSPASAALNGNCLYMYLPNWHANIMRYDDLWSSFRLWYLELASIRERYFTLLCFNSISLSVGPLCTGLISAWFSCAGSWHNLTFQFALGCSTKQLHHSAVSSTPRDTMMYCFCNLFNSSSKGFYSAYALHLIDTWCGLLSSFSCNRNVSSKHPIPLNTSSKSLCSCFVISTLFLLSLSSINPGGK